MSKNIIILFSLLILSGCGSEKDQTTTPKKSKDDITTNTLQEVSSSIPMTTLVPSTVINTHSTGNPSIKVNSQLVNGVINTDGLRPDVLLAINNKFTRNTEQKSAIVQLAKAIQKTLITGTDSVLIDTASQNVIDAVDCINERFSSNSAINQITFTENLVIDTPQRIEDYFKFNSAMNGHFFASNTGTSKCTL